MAALVFERVRHLPQQIRDVMPRHSTLPDVRIHVEGVVFDVKRGGEGLVHVGEAPVAKTTQLEDVVVDVVQGLVPVVLRLNQTRGVGHSVVGKLFSQVEAQDVPGLSILQRPHANPPHGLCQAYPDGHLGKSRGRGEGHPFVVQFEHASFHPAKGAVEFAIRAFFGETKIRDGFVSQHPLVLVAHQGQQVRARLARVRDVDGPDVSHFAAVQAALRLGQRAPHEPKQEGVVRGQSGPTRRQRHVDQPHFPPRFAQMNRVG